jgi:hypothetical protein
MKAGFLTLAVCAGAAAQPVNLDLNDHFATPGGAYGAASGQAGHWNVTNGESIELLDLEGAPAGIKLSFPQGSGFEVNVDNPFLVGDDHALLDDALATADVVLIARFDDLDNGPYDVYAYASPLSQDTVTTFFIGNGDESQFFNLQGGWNGNLEEGVNFAHAKVDVTNGRIDVEWVSGFFGGLGYLSGIQLVPAGACNADVNGDGVLNILDFIAFQELFQAGDPAADCDDNGALNILDFICYQGVFQAGCP